MDSLATTVGLTATKLEKMIAGGGIQPRGKTPHLTGAGKRRTLPSGAGQPSVVRHAITIILNHPEASQTLDIDKLDGVTRPGTDLLRALIETVRTEPNITTAGLLERWRHDEQDEDFSPAAELDECLDQLATAGRKERIDFLIEKQKVNGISDDEKAELRALTSGPIAVK
jgi:DNA primase